VSFSIRSIMQPALFVFVFAYVLPRLGSHGGASPFAASHPGAISFSTILVPGLVAHPGVGFVVAHSTEDGIVVLGTEGEHRLRDGRVTGVDPLARYGPMAPAFVTRAAEMSEAPDLYVNSLVDDLDEVAAFEGLVGCHGGLGGWQDRAMLVHPTALRPPEGLVVGADAMHRVLVGWLEDLGHRQELRGKVTT